MDNRDGLSPKAERDSPRDTYRYARYLGKITGRL